MRDLKLLEIANATVLFHPAKLNQVDESDERKRRVLFGSE